MTTNQASQETITNKWSRLYGTLYSFLGTAMIEGFGEDGIQNLLTSITGIEWTREECSKAGERIYNLEKMFNFREGFKREDDRLPDRFFEEPLTMGPGKGKVLNKDEFDRMLEEYYVKRGWNPETSKPTRTKLEELGLAFTL